MVLSFPIMGHDIADFCLHSQECKVQYDEQMELFKKNILEDDDFSNKYGYLGSVTVNSGVLEKRQLTI